MLINVDNLLIKVNIDAASTRPYNPNPNRDNHA
jgi:hypothetical protein